MPVRNRAQMTELRLGAGGSRFSPESLTNRDWVGDLAPRFIYLTIPSNDGMITII